MLIAFAGKAGSGKDVAGDLICWEHQAVKVSLADPMKRICRDVYGFSDEQLWGASEHRSEPVERLNGLTARHALQQLGTNWGRGCYENTWVDILIRTHLMIQEGTHDYSAHSGLYKAACDVMTRDRLKGRHVVCTDVRFPNEVEAINRAGGKVIHIIRPEQRNLQGAAGLHASEVSLDGIPEDQFACTIRNDGTLDAFRHMVRATYQHVTSGAEGRLWLASGIDVVAL